MVACSIVEKLRLVTQQAVQAKPTSLVVQPFPQYPATLWGLLLHLTGPQQAFLWKRLLSLDAFIVQQEIRVPPTHPHPFGTFWTAPGRRVPGVPQATGNSAMERGTASEPLAPTCAQHLRLQAPLSTYPGAQPLPRKAKLLYLSQEGSLRTQVD